ncbi:MAG: translation initiation factor IF-2 [Candidatus Niyogibacteria bacterium]|nr:translation initiation factor IF-2 [Candidatus Niyogibacteria bacterium]
MNKQPTEQNLIARAPVVVVVGHIDHGKTSLLDFIRRANVTEQESGGITQHIGAYETTVATKTGAAGKLTFLDTPGHEAFSEMRSRGARVADIAILVVAADEGVKPQTEESIRAIKKAELPFVVALNKMDKEGANPDRVKMALAEKEVFVEGYGGNVPCVPISAKKGTGVEELLETVFLLAELEDLKADAAASAEGVVIESSLDQRRGNAATLLIQNGTLRAGEFVAAGKAIAPVRIFEDFKGHVLKEATFSSPVRIVGFSELPAVGASFKAYPSRKEAERALEEVAQAAVVVKKSDTEVAVGGVKMTTVPLIIKADVSGSLEALLGELKKFNSEKLAVKVLRSGTGLIGEDDLKAALGAKDVIVLGFRVGIEKNVLESLKESKVTHGTFQIIYEASDWLKAELEKRLPQETERVNEGRAKVQKLFKKTGAKQVVGGRVLEGALVAGGRFNILRNDHPLGEGRILELQSGKERAERVESGSEYGLLVTSEITIAPGDILEIFTERIVQGKI